VNILVTGGAGYIGSHTCVELMRAGHRVAIFDNFSNSKPDVITRIARITGEEPKVVRGDVRSRDQVTAALEKYRCEAVVHFAGFAESVKDPLLYYSNNVVGPIVLGQSMVDVGVNRLVFSSSATVYGDPIFLPLTRDHPGTPMAKRNLSSKTS
jgi:UDP-glucose 4-epimerase